MKRKEIPLTIKRSKNKRKTLKKKAKLLKKEKSWRDITKYVKKFNAENLSKQSGTLL